MKAIHSRMSLLAGAVALSLGAGAAHAASIKLYKQPNFAGPALTVDGEKGNLQGTGYYDQVSSIVVDSGRWQVCSQPNFQGDCMILERGQYATLDPKINHRIESVREVAPVVAEKREGRDRDGRYADRDGRYADRDGRFADRDARRADFYAESRSYGRRGPGAIELFAGPAFRGPAVIIERDAWTLRESGFDERVSSVVVHDGRWQVCTDAGFEGECRVLEPGRYSHLGRFDNQIGSVRRVS